jgi:hypothetical protein
MNHGTRDAIREIPADWSAAAGWLEAGLAALRGLAPSGALAASVEPVIHQEEESSALGRYGQRRWRSFVLGTFLADLASYPAPVDQVGFERLAYVMAVFPRGFRLWGCDVGGAGWLPVGYSGWYPIAATSFELLEQKAASLRDRTVVPLPDVEPGGSFVYVFNFSIVPELRQTAASKRLVRALAEDITAARPRGLSAITVSPEGARVVERFGMKRTGAIVIGGGEEQVFTCRAPAMDDAV